MDLTSFCIYGFKILILVYMVCCGDPPCPSNIKSCYNCEVIGGCNQTEFFNTTEERCLNYLTQQVSLWSVEYNFASGTCQGSNCEDMQIKHNAEKVVHQKTCDTECGTYNLTRIPKNKVIGNVYVPLNITTSLQDWECLSFCLATNASCTVAYESNNKQCFFYSECQDNCTLQDKQMSWKVYIKSCKGSTTLQQLKLLQTTIAQQNTTTLSTTIPTTTAAPSTVSPSAAAPSTTSTSAAAPSTVSPSAASPSITSSSAASPSTTSLSATDLPTTSTSATALPTTSTSSTASVVQTTAKPVKKLYIMPCLCYKNKTFTNLTQEEIIAQLIKDTKIDMTKTALAQSRLISRKDSRTSSAAIGAVGLAILCCLGGIMVCCDMITICDKIKSRAEKYKCSSNTSNDSLDDDYNYSEEAENDDYYDDDDDDDDDTPPPVFRRYCWIKEN